MHHLTLHPKPPPHPTEIYLGKRDEIESKLMSLCLHKRPVIVADAALERLYGEPLAKKLHASLLSVPSGEKAKTKKSYDHLIDQLFQLKSDRETLLIGLGGGATTDLVSFAASTYMRGIPLILVPTSLLAIVDASIGGKTGIDMPYGKNLIGTNYHPQAILANLDALQTLPEEEWRNGFAEIVKMGLIRDRSIWEMAKHNQKDPALILKAMEGKIGIVEEDPFENGLRRTLNFGHTIGHALELISEYELAHGQAVWIGSLVESHLSMQLGFLSKDAFAEIKKELDPFVKKLPRNYDRNHLIQAMSYDKKKAQGKIRFVLLGAIGKALFFDGAYCRTVSEEELTPSLLWMENHYGL